MKPNTPTSKDSSVRSAVGRSYLGFNAQSEIVLGLVCPMGTNYESIVQSLTNYAGHYGYQTNLIRVSELFDGLLRQLGEKLPPPQGDPLSKMRWKIGAGNTIRKRVGLAEALALAVAREIHSRRKWQSDAELPEASERVIHVIASLKRPEEVNCLRHIYGPGFFLIGLSASKSDRIKYLGKHLGVDESKIPELMDVDEFERNSDDGQRTRKTYELSDVFVQAHDQLKRFLDLVFGCPFETPSRDEYAMYLAYESSWRSGDLARQVGAALIDERGDVLSVGYNEAPVKGGGLCGPGDKGRDVARKYDANDLEKGQLADRVVGLLRGGRRTRGAVSKKRIMRALHQAGFFDITEFGRSVHAEMEAILACARSGRSTVGATLFTTTFPCHNCTRHIIGAGIARVVYIEPYPKSKATTLHDDAISVEGTDGDKIPFESFVGVGPRRYLDLFSMSLGAGYQLERKREGKVVEWTPLGAQPRLQLQPTSYLQREMVAGEMLKNLSSSRGSMK